MMRRIIENSHGHPLKNQKIFLSGDYPCTACSQGKLIVRPSHSKVFIESPTFLERIQGIYVDQFIHHVDHFAISWC